MADICSAWISETIARVLVGCELIERYIYMIKKCPRWTREENKSVGRDYTQTNPAINATTAAPKTELAVTLTLTAAPRNSTGELDAGKLPLAAVGATGINVVVLDGTYGGAARSVCKGGET